MSEVAAPVIALSLGAVGVPQADVMDLTVHLGCSKEVSSFEALLHNWNGKYSQGGLYPILVGATGGVGICRAPNNPAAVPLISLKVESVKYESDPFDNLVRVSGRCWGEWLFRRVITKTYVDTKGEDVIKDLIDSFTDLGHVRNTTELIVDTDTTFTKLEYENTPLWDIIKYVAETSDKAGVIGFDFRVAPDGLFEFFPKNSKTNSVDLTDKIEFSEYRKDITRIRNSIKIFGEATKGYPLDKDGLTEILHPPYGDWRFENGTGGDTVPPPGDGGIAQDATVQRIGTSSIKVHIENYWGGGCSFTFKDGWEVDFNKYPLFFFFAKFEPTWSSEGAVVITDVNGKFIKKNHSITPDNQWKSCKIGGGADNSGEWDIVQDGFDWTRIKKVLIHHMFPKGSDLEPVNGWGDYWIDGMYFGGCRYSATQESAPSAGLYGLREFVEIEEELWSDNECDLRAKALLAYLKDPAEYLTIKSSVVDFGTSPILAGDKVHIALPVDGVNADFRVEYIEYQYKEDQTLDLLFELGKEPPQIADYLYGLRTFTVNVEKLARTKQGNRSTASFGGSNVSSGGGTIGYNGVGLLEVRCAVPEYDFETLEPYLWGFNGGGEWTPDALTLPLGTSTIRFKDEESLNWLEMGLIIAGQDDLGPVLWLSQHLIVKKDFACGGMITSFQGALFLGSGLQAQADMPQIILAHSEAAYGNMDTLEVWRFGKPGLAKVKCEQLLVNSITKVNGEAFSDFLIPDEYGYVTITGIHFGSDGGHSWGDIYRSTVNDDDIIVVSGLGLGLDGYLNCKSISLNPPAGTPALASDSSTEICTGINADLLDGHHAEDFAVLDEYGYTSVSGIRFGAGWGEIYRSNVSGDNIIVISGLGVGLNGYLNCKSISLNPPAGIPAIGSDSAAEICTNLNADLLDGHHASDFLTEIGQLALSNMPQGTSGYVLTGQGVGNWPQYSQVDYLLTTVSADCINRGGWSGTVPAGSTISVSHGKVTGYST